MGPSSHMTGILMKRGNLDTDIHMGRRACYGEDKEYHVEVKTKKAKVMLLQAKECRGLPENLQKLEEGHGVDSSSQPTKGTDPDNTLISDF